MVRDCEFPHQRLLGYEVRISGAEATELCAHHLAPKLPGVDFSWEEPIVRVPDEFAHIVGTGVKERERFSLHCSVDLINAEVVGSQHGLI